MTPHTVLFTYIDMIYFCKNVLHYFAIKKYKELNGPHPIQVHYNVLFAPELSDFSFT